MSIVHTMYRQIHPATGIELSVYCNLIHPVEKCLVIAGVNQLYIFKLRHDSSRTSNGSRTDKPAGSKRVRLECFANFTLFGNIVSMQPVRLASATHDSLLLSFRDAKLSLVEYDPSSHELKTLSLHYFEDDELKDGRSQHACSLPIVRVDTDSRCAAMLTYSRRLVVLPFRHDVTGSVTTEPLFSGGEPTGQSQVLSSYIIDLHKMEEKIVNVVDFQFLHGYHEPTVVILYEPLPTWAGRIAMRKDTCCIIAVSLNLEQRLHPVIWSVENLPFDCRQIQPVPRPFGGLLILAVNSLLYLNQSFPPFGVSLNSLTNNSTDFPLKTQEGAKITLDCSQACFIASDKLVISLRGGELYVLTLLSDGGMRAVRSFHLDRAAASVITTSICECGPGYIFLGSRLGNSILLRYSEKLTPSASDTIVLDDVSVTISDGEYDDDLLEPTKKKRKKKKVPTATLR